MEALLACNLLPLNKNPGVRKIGVLKSKIQEIVGPVQVASWLESDPEAVIHTMREIFQYKDWEAIVLLDASNVFNSLNRQVEVVLHNTQYICPHLAKVLLNTYHNPSRLIISNGKEIL